MNKDALTSDPRYRSPLREAQALATRERIAEAAFAVFRERGGQEDLTFKEVAKAAGVTEMTVYRHFPSRDDLLRALWKKVNASIGVAFPESLDDLLENNEALYLGYEKSAPAVMASITSRQGREMRLSRKSERQKAFLKVAEEVNPRLAPRQKKRLAALLQLLQSSYAWDSMRGNWDMDPKEIADATRLAIEAIVRSVRQPVRERKQS